MKKTLGMMALGMGMGAAGMFVFDKYKSGDLQKMVKKTEKKIDQMMN